MPTPFMEKIDACLQCTLPICNDKDARCAFIQIEKANGNDRTEYWRIYYEKNRAKKIEAAKMRQQENWQEHLEACRRHRKRKALPPD